MPHESFCAEERPIGILMLDTTFERILGDIGNPGSFNFPVKYKTVSSATTDKIVAEGNTARALLPLFIKAAQELEAEGVKAITTSCGFLALVQKELSAAVNIPVVTSSLLLVPMVHAMIAPDKRVGIITANDQALSQEHLSGVGITEEIMPLIVGLQSSKAFSQAILEPKSNRALDPIHIEKELLAIAEDLCHPENNIGAIVLECTNLQPYAPALRKQCNLPIFGIIDLVNFTQRGLA